MHLSSDLSHTILILVLISSIFVPLHCSSPNDRIADTEGSSSSEEEIEESGEEESNESGSEDDEDNSSEPSQEEMTNNLKRRTIPKEEDQVEKIEEMISIPENKLTKVVERAYESGAKYASNLFVSIVGKDLKRDLNSEQPIGKPNSTLSPQVANGEPDRPAGNQTTNLGRPNAKLPKFRHVFKIKSHSRNGHGHEKKRFPANLKFSNPYYA